MSSRQQVLFLLQKTQKEANWDMNNDSDFQEGMTFCKLKAIDDSIETTHNQTESAIIHYHSKKAGDTYQIPYNEEFEIKRERLRQTELRDHPERFRLLAHSLKQFMPIKKNKYLERKRHILLEKEANALICTCQKASSKKNEKTNPHQSFNCSDRCINRCVSTECCSMTCPSGAFCMNRRFQLHQNSYVYPAKTEKKGWGLFAGEFIPKGTFIMQYVGEVFSVDSDLGQQRVLEYKHSTCTYLMRTTNNEVIDPTYVGNIARFINHSCDPNCETQKWNVLGEVCVGIFSLKDIKENEELSFDYQFDFFKTPYTKCYCGTAKCKGYLGILATATNDAHDSATLSAATCGYCQKIISGDREEVLVCKGPCRGTFHIICTIQKEGKNRAQTFAQSLDKRNFICKACYFQINGRKKRGRKSQKDIDFLREQDTSAPMTLNQSENPQEDKDFELPPWESKDPNIRKFFEDNIENRRLDKFIAREVEQIQKDKEMKGKKKRKGQFSEFYNFMCELTKRLKKFNPNKQNYKFRKNKELTGITKRTVQTIVPTQGNILHLTNQLNYPSQVARLDSYNKTQSLMLPSSDLQSLQMTSNNKDFDVNHVLSEQNDDSNNLLTTVQVKPQKRGRPKRNLEKMQIPEIKGHIEGNEDSMAVEEQISTTKRGQNVSKQNNQQRNQQPVSKTKRGKKGSAQSDSKNESLRLKESQLAKIALKKNDDHNDDQDDASKDVEMTVQVGDDEEMKFSEDEKSESSHAEEHSSGDYEEDQSDLEVDDEDAEIEEMEDDEDIEEDESNEFEQEEEEEVEDEENELEEEEDEDEIEDEDEEVIDQEQEEYRRSFELNLEQLQGEAAEEEEAKTSKNEDLKKRSSGRFAFQEEEISIAQCLKQLSAEHSATEAIELLKRTPIKFQSPRKNSIIHNPYNNINDQTKDRQTIKKLVQQKIDAFVKEQIYLIETKLDEAKEVKESKFNVYESVFNMTIPEYVEDLQCLPNFQIYWEQAWGGMVTIRIVSTYKQFLFLTSLLQEVTDLLYRSHLLNGGKYDLNQQVSDLPFEILLIKVPKNFIRKLVGYQEKILAHYRKAYTVDFDFNRELMIDDVFQMNETTHLRIFGKSSDVHSVNSFIQRDLEQIKMKTIFLQMNDCKILMDNVKEVKVLVDPCEIRVKRMTREWKDLRHPFYYLPNYFREMVLIGTSAEIEYAEKQIEKFFASKREVSQVNNQQISFLLPIQLKGIYNDLKNEIVKRYPLIQVFFYEPTYPRKHLTVLMIGPWQMLLGSKNILEEEVNKYLIRSGHSFQNFQQFTYHQQIRFSFKSLKRFVLEKDIKYLNHWDLVSVFVENAGKYREEQTEQLAVLGGNSLSRTQSILDLMIKEKSQNLTSNSIAFNEKESDFLSLIQFLKEQDPETCINILFVLTNTENDSLESLMQRLQVSKNDLLVQMSQILEQNIEEYRESIRYSQRGFYHEEFKASNSDFTQAKDSFVHPATAASIDPLNLKVHRSRSPSMNSKYPRKDDSCFHNYYQRSSARVEQMGRYVTRNETMPMTQQLYGPQSDQNREIKRERSESRGQSQDRRRSNSSSNSSKGSYDRRKSYHKWNQERKIGSPDFTRPPLDKYPSNRRHDDDYKSNRYSSSYYDRRKHDRSRSRSNHYRRHSSRYHRGSSYYHHYRSSKRSSSNDSYSDRRRRHKSSRRHHYHRHRSSRHGHSGPSASISKYSRGRSLSSSSEDSGRRRRSHSSRSPYHRRTSRYDYFYQGRHRSRERRGEQTVPLVFEKPKYRRGFDVGPEEMRLLKLQEQQEALSDPKNDNNTKEEGQIP